MHCEVTRTNNKHFFVVLTKMNKYINTCIAHGSC